MIRVPIAAALGLIAVAPAFGQCLPGYPVYPSPPIYVPVYPLTPAVWGAPAPRPLPPAPAPTAPRKEAGVREEDDLPPPKAVDKAKEDPKTGEPKRIDVPKLPKLKLPIPGDPDDLDPPAAKPRKDRTGDEPAPKKDPPEDRGKAIEQFIIPAEGDRAEPRQQVKVGFFNHSEREITLEVNGESVRLPREQYVTLRLPRTFSWSEKGRKATDVAVPPDAAGIEIVFRR